MPLNTVPLHVRGGVIFPLQMEAMNTVLARKNPFQLLVALDDYNSAKGELFVDDGVSVHSMEKEYYTKVVNYSKPL